MRCILRKFEQEVSHMQFKHTVNQFENNSHGKW